MSGLRTRLETAGAGPRADLTRDHEWLTRVVDRIPLATVAFDREARVMTWNASGRLSIDSAVGLGTIVEITLPAADAAAVEQTEQVESRPPPRGAERVLVVEDRDVVRELARDLLESSGFAVTAVAGGHEALAAVCAGEPFDLLLTDVVMPEMSGPELAQQLRSGRPSLPVLYMSGYTDDVLDADELLQEGTAFLRKPFGSAELVGAVRDALDEPAAIR